MSPVALKASTVCVDGSIGQHARSVRYAWGDVHDCWMAKESKVGLNRTPRFPRRMPWICNAHVGGKVQDGYLVFVTVPPCWFMSLPATLSPSLPPAMLFTYRGVQNRGKHTPWACLALYLSNQVRVPAQ